VNTQLEPGEWNGRADWFAIPNETDEGVTDNITLGCLEPYDNKCTHIIQNSEINSVTGQIESGYFFGNWRIEFTNSDNFEVDGNGKLVWVEDSLYKLYYWQPHYVLRETTGAPVINGPTSGTISLQNQETEITLTGTSELLVNGNFSSISGTPENSVPVGWTSTGEPMNPTDIDQSKLLQGIIKKTTRIPNPQVWLSQLLQKPLEINTRYSILLENPGKHTFSVKMRRNSGMTNTPVTWNVVDGVEVNEESRILYDFKESATFTTSSYGADSIDICFKWGPRDNELHSVSLRGISLPELGSKVILPKEGGGVKHDVVSVGTHSFLITGLFQNLAGKRVAYDGCGGHIVSNYNVSRGWQDYDEHKYWVSENMTTLTNCPPEETNARYFLDYIIIKYPRFDDLL